MIETVRELEWTCQLIIMSNLFVLLHAEVHCSQALFYELHEHDDGCLVIIIYFNIFIILDQVDDCSNWHC